MNLLYDEAFALAVNGMLVVVALPFVTERRWRPLLAFVGAAMAWTAVVGAPLFFGWHVGNWNWIGKVASICAGLALVVLLRLTRKEVGLVLPQGRRAWLATAAGIGSAVLFFVCLSVILGPNYRPDV